MRQSVSISQASGATPVLSKIRASGFVSEKSTVLGVIVAGALFRIVSLCFSDNAGGDAGAHVSLAADWLTHPDLRLIFEAYPPGHFWLIGLFSMVVRNVVWAGRLLSLVCGIGSLYFVWKIARLLWGEIAAVFSLTAFALYSLHIGYSATSSAEVPYLFFLLVATAFFFAGAAEEENNLKTMALSGLSLSIAESIRYEAWAFFASLVAGTIAVWLYRRQRLHLTPISFGTWVVSACLWPAVMMTYCWHVYGDPMYLVTWNRLRVAHTLLSVPYSHQLMVFPAALLLSLSPLTVIAAMVGIVFSLSDTLPGVFTVATLIFASVEAYELMTGGLLGTARYTITLGALLCIVSGCGFERIIRKLAPSRWKLALGIVFALLSLNAFALVAIAASSSPVADRVASVSPWLRYQPHIAEVGKFLRAHLGPDDAVVFDDYNVESNILADASGFPPVPGRRAYLVGKKYPTTVSAYIQEQHPRFLVFSDRGTLHNELQIRPGCATTQQVGGIELHCVFAGQVYRVFELRYP